MPRFLHIDFETRSVTDLKKAGLDNYVACPTTQPWCLAAAVGDGEPELWRPDLHGWDFDSAFSPAFYEAWDDPETRVVAHNAGFELDVWNRIMVPRHGWPALDPRRTLCTMAMAYAMALPGDLDRAAPALGLSIRKDDEGHRLMRLMAKPKDIYRCPECDATGCPACGDFGEEITWHDDPAKIERLGAYCLQDVRVEQALHERLMDLSPAEYETWHLDYRINRRGVAIDRPVVDAAIAIAQHEKIRLNDELRRITGGVVTGSSQNARLTKWVQDQGVSIEGVAKDDVLDALEDATLPAHVREALIVRRAAGKTSTAKLTPMVEAASADGRLRGMFQYHGAATGRWAGRKVQLQNLPRPQFKHGRVFDMVEVLRSSPVDEALIHLDLLYGNPLDCLSQCLRSMLIAGPGKTLFVVDFSNIEGRGIAWQAGEEWKLDAFRAYDAKTGHDIYKLTAGGILNKPPEEVTADERQTFGKVPELACGYGGGVGAFQQMAKTYLVKIPDEQAESIKNGWRQKHPAIAGVRELGVKGFWGDLEDAARAAVMNPGTEYYAGPPGRGTTFLVSGSFLWAMLPSGRALCYPYPSIKPKVTPWGETRDQVHYWHLNGVTNRWEETSTYGGKLSENTTQAICRDILRDAMLRVDEEFPIVMHVHDEIVSEMPRGHNGFERFEALVKQPPAWATGFPIAVDGWQGERYRK